MGESVFPRWCDVIPSDPNTRPFLKCFKEIGSVHIIVSDFIVYLSYWINNRRFLITTVENVSKILTIPQSPRRGAATISQEYRIDNLYTILFLKQGNHFHRSHYCFIQRSTTRSQLIRDAISRVGIIFSPTKRHP